ncbi:MAG: hypothetical protein H5U18_15250, partial [Rhodobacteraceae bacterium]|nr:hypothetical protein [Paracoccaceae bacterium]
MAAIVILAGALCLPAALRAKTAECRANLNGVEITIPYDRAADVWSSFREKRLTRARTCPGAVVIAHMMPGPGPINPPSGAIDAPNARSLQESSRVGSSTR